ncbi:MAG: hypothetical protein P1U78_03225 [Alcanivoracaceae bacterium]|nr:hypothetical protein [Alcanivoracaceae bacterium]
MIRSNWLRATAYTVIALQALWLAACGTPPAAEQAISKAIKEIAEGIEQRDSSAVVEHLHPDLQINERNHGSLDLDQARRIMTATFFRHRNISVVLTNIQVTPDNIREDLATAHFNALVTGGSGGILPDQAQLYRVESQWLNDGDWKLVSLQAKRALE